MRMIVVPRLAGPEVLTLVDAPMPVAGADQLVVRLDYALVGFADVYQREGVYRTNKTLSPSETPLKIGGGGAGTVVSAGAQVAGFAPGDRVIYGAQLGSYAEYVAVPAWRATKFRMASASKTSPDCRRRGRPRTTWRMTPANWRRA